MHRVHDSMHLVHMQRMKLPMLETYLDCDSAERVAWDRLNAAPVSAHWSIEDEPEAALHRIHTYPAKFPAFLTRRALAYAAEQDVVVGTLGDVFCGCGTVAHEARRAGLAFWGCDINPVAIMIARAKSSPLQGRRLLALAERVLAGASTAAAPAHLPEVKDFLQRWHSAEQLEALGRLLASIETVTSPRSRYRIALLCAFSSILRSCSYWKSWSIKPRVDLDKAPRSVSRAFNTACVRLARAYDEANWGLGPTPKLHLADVRTVPLPEQCPDLLVCSAPYATSVDYAELHQLSASWLGHFPEMTALRRASIGTPLVGAKLRDRHTLLNRVGLQVVFSLYAQDPFAATAIANYFVDMQQVARRCLDFLTPKGIAVFVIGNARLRGQVIDNAAHFTEALLDAGFARVRVARRQVSNKATSPFRDTLGRLQRDQSEHRQYDQEFILIAHRP
jgi:SAM-dependent methyltransferase